MTNSNLPRQISAAIVRVLKAHGQLGLSELETLVKGEFDGVCPDLMIMEALLRLQDRRRVVCTLGMLSLRK